MSADDEPDTCYRWSRDFLVAHAVFASGFVTAPVAVLLLVHRPRSGRAIFFAAFAAFCTTSSLVLCLRFYAELRRPPWPRWRSAAAASGRGQQQQQDGESVVVGRETTARETSHALRHPEQPVTRHAEVQAALASGRIPSYEHQLADDGGDVAEDCAVCLGGVEEGETVRRLPACQHVFHKGCIDPWLRAHATCPVCRSGVLPAPERPVEVVVVEHLELFVR
ncbi:RING-H2 finger protein ATL3-like [Panicum miliaceum]|uniref:RING-H2 finger protein ATL3-like n=1 Tax=Panicum miliaceum TaxID=4540 RepID=A0A3L6QGD1_PANMI|nr:RING-H2 finger protein ATL3-like [Panicum miliaceum]